jgi:hypothetical protein
MSNISLDAQCAPVWIGTDEFSTLADITERGGRNAIIKCLSGGAYKGNTLTVRTIESNVGRGGNSYQVFVPSLPQDLRAIWHKQHPEALNPPAVAPVMLPAPECFDRRMAKEVAEWKWKLSIITPALAFPKNSKGRGAVLEEIARRFHQTLDGKKVTYTVATLRVWIQSVEDGEPTKLARKRRKKGLRRAMVTRKWDKAAPFPEPEKNRIATEIEEHTRKLWRDGAPGWKRVEQLSSSKLWEISRAAGWSDAPYAACNVGRHWVERHRDSSLIAIREKDAKRFADEFTPRIIRNRNGYKPMDIIIGDVHPLDVVKLHDGREVHARLIAWLDLATNDIFCTVVLPPKGRGIRQENVAASFVEMVTAWGLPRHLYLDNGSEYKWAEMMAGFDTISALVSGFHAFINDEITDEIHQSVDEQLNGKSLTRAKPYNASAKQAEGIFGILERGFFSAIKGWVGGDRMNKRTHRVGAQPRAFDGTEQEFNAAIQEAIAFYRNTPQNGKTSPNQKRTAFYADGWKPYTVAEEVFLFAFSEVVRLKVTARGIEKDGVIYYSDALIPYIGKTRDIHFAKWNRSHLFLIDDQGKYIAIPQAPTFGQLDTAGAIEQGRRQSEQNKHIRALKGDGKKLDLLEEMTRHNAAQPAPPALPAGIPITLGADSQGIAAALLAVIEPTQAVPRLNHGEAIDNASGKIVTLINYQPPPSKPSMKSITDSIIEKFG